MSKLGSALSIDGMLSTVRQTFSLVPDVNNGRSNQISLTDCLMSGLAIFSLKFPSLLQFDNAQKKDKGIIQNLKSLFKIKQPISDTQIRQRLDVIPPKDLRKPFASLFAKLQRGNHLKKFKHINNTYLMAIDGTGFFHSKTIHCENCCEKHHSDGTITYYHLMVCGALVHPNLKEVIPFAPEPILKQDGSTKNDCELNAVKRYLRDFRREHSHLNVTIIEDALFAKGPHIKLLNELSMNYIIVVKPKDHKYLFDAVKNSKCTEIENIDDKETRRIYKYINGMPLNYTHHDLLVNFIDYTEINKMGKVKHCTWVTDHEITNDNVSELIIAGKARWKIENETFNTLKNQGYNFEHNFGHGKKNLNSVFATLMMLAFFIDQIQSLCCETFNAVIKQVGRKLYLWENIRNLFQIFIIDTWKDLYSHLLIKVMIPIPLAEPP